MIHTHAAITVHGIRRCMVGIRATDLTNRYIRGVYFSTIEYLAGIGRAKLPDSNAGPGVGCIGRFSEPVCGFSRSINRAALGLQGLPTWSYLLSHAGYRVWRVTTPCVGISGRSDIACGLQFSSIIQLLHRHHQHHTRACGVCQCGGCAMGSTLHRK